MTGMLADSKLSSDVANDGRCITPAPLRADIGKGHLLEAGLAYKVFTQV